MVRNKKAVSDSQLVYMMAVIDEHLRSAKQTDTIRELLTKFDKVSKPYRGSSMLTIDQVKDAYELQEGFISACFPNLQKTIYPDQAETPKKNKTPGDTQTRTQLRPKEGKEVTTALEQAIEKLTLNINIIRNVPEQVIKESDPEATAAADKPTAKSPTKEEKTNKPVEAKPVAAAPPKKITSSQNITLQEKIDALKTAYKSKEIEPYPAIKKYLQNIIHKLKTMQSEPVKKQLIAEKFGKLDAYISDKNASVTTAYIIYQSHNLLATTNSPPPTIPTPVQTLPILEERLGALREASNSEEIKPHSEIKEHLTTILNQLGLMESQLVKNQIITEKFGQLDAYIAGQDKKATAAYIVHQTYQLLPEPIKTMASGTSVRADEQKKGGTSITSASEQPKQAPTPSLTNQEKALALLERYAEHLSKELKKNTAILEDDKTNYATKFITKRDIVDIQLKQSTVETVTKAIKESTSKEKAVGALNAGQDNLSFNRGLLSLFGMKTSLGGSTGEDCVKDVKQALNAPSDQPFARPSPS
jgi:hypothetical protein